MGGAGHITARDPEHPVQATAGYLFAEYDSYKGAGGAGVDADGNRLTNSPHWSLSAAFNWDVPVKVPGSLRLGANANYQTKTQSSATPAIGGQNVVPAQGFLNAVVTWTAPDPHYSVVLSGRNLLNADRRRT